VPQLLRNHRRFQPLGDAAPERYFATIPHFAFSSAIHRSVRASSSPAAAFRMSISSWKVRISNFAPTPSAPFAEFPELQLPQF